VYADLIEDEQSAAPESISADALRAAELEAALESLNPRLRYVVESRFGIGGNPPKTLEEVGAHLNITRERVRVMESQALRSLRRSTPSLIQHLR
jgi:RNA polymerase primary sigma factor